MKQSLPRPGTAPPSALLTAILLSASGLSLALVSVTGAHAQMANPAISNGIATGPVVGTATPQGRKEAPPPALPGARTPDTEPAPIERPAAEMRPNEALFELGEPGRHPRRARCHRARRRPERDQ